MLFNTCLHDLISHHNSIRFQLVKPSINFISGEPLSPEEIEARELRKKRKLGRINFEVSDDNSSVPPNFTMDFILVNSNHFKLNKI